MRDAYQGLPFLGLEGGGCILEDGADHIYISLGSLLAERVPTLVMDKHDVR
jgi:hypothetical protein